MIQFGKSKIKFDSVKINASYSKQVVQVQDLLKHVSKDSGVCWQWYRPLYLLSWPFKTG